LPVDGGLDVRHIARHNQRGVQKRDAVDLSRILQNGHFVIRLGNGLVRGGECCDGSDIEGAARRYARTLAQIAGTRPRSSRTRAGRDNCLSRSQ